MTRFVRAAAIVVVATVGSGTPVLAPASALPAVPVSEVYVVPPSGTWTVNGAGWGHGIGMSQWGAQGAALQGRSFAQILGFYYPGTSLGLVGNPNIRVQLTKYSGGVIFFGRIGTEELTARDVASGQTQVLPASSRYLLTIDASGMYLGQWTSEGWSSLPFNGSNRVDGPIEVTGPSGTRVDDPSLSGAGTQYRGSLELVRTSSTSAQAVNQLDLDAYLKGVVPRESPSSWHPEALRAQAVAARSYALSTSSPAGSWDICDTTQCQVYGGRAVVAPNGTILELEAASSSSAVDTTSGVVVAFNNLPAFTQFSSSNGGYSVAGSKPYLVAQPDPYSGSAPGDPVSRWQAQLPASRLQAQCPSGGALSSFEITGRDGRGSFGGRVTAVKVNCSTGSRNITDSSTLSFGMLSRMWQPVAPTGSSPIGQVDRLASLGLTVRVSGWALDPNTAYPVEVHVYVDGGGYNLGPANLSRPDVAAAYPGYGAAHGFDATLPISVGAHQVCVYAINVGVGANRLLSCRGVTGSSSPFGRLDLGGPGPTPATMRLAGWAVDPNTPLAPIEVHAYVDGGGHNLGVAAVSRPDVADAFPGFGDAHGFDATLVVAPGPHVVCLYAINTGPGSNTGLGCSQVVVSGTPIGNLEQVSGSTGAIQVSGWALDPDTPNPIEVHVYVDGGGYNLGPTSVARPDVAQAFPGYGELHGFSWTVPVSPGPHDVCTFAINVGYGTHGQLGCRTVTST